MTPLYCSARRISPAEATGCPSSVKAAAPEPGELGHLGQLLAAQALRDRGHEAGRDLRLLARLLDQGAEDRGRVDDGVGVRHREDRAVAAGGRRGRAGRDRLLVLAAGHAQVHVRVDEGGREHEARAPTSTAGSSSR